MPGAAGAVPGDNGMSDSAEAIISNLLSGTPSPSQSKRDAAFFGTSAGIPGSEMATRFGYDLYNQRGDERQQRGIQDLLSWLASGREDKQLRMSYDKQRSDDAFRRSQLDEQRRQFDKNNPAKLTSDWEGRLYDEAGQRAGYSELYDNAKKFRGLPTHGALAYR